MRKPITLVVFLSLFCLFALSTPAWSTPITLTFDELPYQSVDDLSFQGVTFDFKVGGVDSLDAYYNSGGPGTITYVQDPSLEGHAGGILTLDFALPTPTLEFGVALNEYRPLTPGFTVELFDPGSISIGVFPVNTNPLISYTEGLFSYAGTLVSRAEIDFFFPPYYPQHRFALDNLTYSPIPEPSTMLLVGSGLVGIGALRRRFKRRK